MKSTLYLTFQGRNEELLEAFALELLENSS
jgi:hypothetical protein